MHMFSKDSVIAKLIGNKLEVTAIEFLNEKYSRINKYNIFSL